MIPLPPVHPARAAVPARVEAPAMEETRVQAATWEAVAKGARAAVWEAVAKGARVVARKLAEFGRRAESLEPEATGSTMPDLQRQIWRQRGGMPRRQQTALSASTSLGSTSLGSTPLDPIAPCFATDPGCKSSRGLVRYLEFLPRGNTWKHTIPH